MTTNWQQLINRIRQEVQYQLRNNNGAKEQGIVRVTVVMLMDIEQPIVWEVESRKIEPGSRARGLLGLCDEIMPGIEIKQLT